MTDHTLARADEVLTELVEMVETARALPMSSSCVLPRERALDLLDALREVLPPEMGESRRIVAQRDRLLAEAKQHAGETMRMATERADADLAAARAQAYNLIEAAQAEQARLVSSASVHQMATDDAGRIRAEADEYAAGVRGSADEHAELARTKAEQYAARLNSEAHGYADRTLSELVATLNRLAGTAENGRTALGERQGVDPGLPGDPAGTPSP